MLAIHSSARTDLSNPACRFAHRRCAVAIPITRCAWVHRRRIRRARRHDGCAANVLRGRHTLGAVRPRFQLPLAAAEVHRVDPAGSSCCCLPGLVVAELRDLLNPVCMGACDGSNHCLRPLCALKSMAKGEAKCASSDSCCGKGTAILTTHEDGMWGTRGVVEHGFYWVDSLSRPL